VSAEAWDFAKLVVTLVVAPAVMWKLNQIQTAKIAKTQADAAKEVKKEVAVAADLAAASLERVEEKVNGNLEVRDARIRLLESKLRDHGISE
jgi:hypothetical protein